MSFINKIRLTALCVIFAISLSCFTAQSQQLSNRKQGTVLEQLEQNSRNNLIDQVINYAYRFRGTPYRYGAMSPRGFDCSGFTSYVFKRFGIELDRSSRGQIFDGVRVKKNDLQPGDLVFFANTYESYSAASHVGIYIGGGQFVHAANSSSGVKVSYLSEDYYSSRYVGARRVY